MMSGMMRSTSIWASCRVAVSLASSSCAIGTLNSCMSRTSLMRTVFMLSGPIQLVTFFSAQRAALRDSSGGNTWSLPYLQSATISNARSMGRYRFLLGLRLDRDLCLIASSIETKCSGAKPQALWTSTSFTRPHSSYTKPYIPAKVISGSKSYTAHDIGRFLALDRGIYLTMTGPLEPHRRQKWTSKKSDQRSSRRRITYTQARSIGCPSSSSTAAILSRHNCVNRGRSPQVGMYVSGPATCLWTATAVLTAACFTATLTT
ncbi:hypothetical protein QBC34DRAFT_208771 [Podospora aff. communis PSN243]|uniref:Secreted protein n=1 Tax=Podospora aff. communis PSN243 TaxID=3040156 RepID=A0AAV9GYQ5_9PEZI|nr:hypothetical protein QBC34DRAFT_208771 [Podospora aff. communis PSN243]